MAANTAAAAAAAVPAGGAANGEAAAPTVMQQIFGVLRMVVMYQLLKYVFGGGGGGGGGAATAKGGAAAVVDPATGKALRASPMWRPGQEFDLRVFLSLEPEADSVHFDDPERTLLWEERALAMDWDEANNRARNVTVPGWALEALQANGSVFAHTFFTQPGAAFDPDAGNFNPLRSAHRAEQLNVYMPRPKVHASKNLLSGEYADERLRHDMSEEEIESAVGAPLDVVNMWRPTLTVRALVDFSTHASPAAIPAPLNTVYDFHPGSGRYWPVIYHDYFWLLQERFVIVNETVTELPLELSFAPVSLLKLQMQLQMEESWRSQEGYGASSAKDTQEFKRMLMDTNPYLLAVTFAVSTLHMIFDFLAFKNDIQFWRENKNTTGLSVRTIVANCVMQLIIFLYLCDNDTSWMILMSSGVGVVIEVWKIRKAAKVTRLESWPYVKIEDKEAAVESGAAEYDRQAMRYMSWVLYPLVVGYSIYSLTYEEHKSWYSWVVGSLVGTVYTFGFIMMCPQLYMNYKLKSVAHLPWRMLTYKALNTFIDDLFAFIIKMPTMHRLSCFRDDIIFFVYIYQRWIYRVDYTRANEFGLVPTAPLEAEEVRDKLGEHPELLRLVADFCAADGEAAPAVAAAAAPAAPAAAALPTTETAEKEETDGVRRRKPRSRRAD